MTIRYFIHGANIAAVEDDGQAERYAAAGWVEVTEGEFVAAWKSRDTLMFSRAVGEADVQRMSWKDRVKRGV